MRYKVNKELVGALRKTSASISTNVPAKVHPVKKDGTPDMRYRNNRTALCSSSYVSSSACSVVTGTLTGGTKSSLGPSLAKVYTVGSLKKNGAPDMRYAVNKQRFGNLPAATTSSRGPLKKDGKPDMRYAANRQSHHPPQSRSQAQGPLKKDGTPDMRYKANRRWYRHTHVYVRLPSVIIVPKYSYTSFSYDKQLASLFLQTFSNIYPSKESPLFCKIIIEVCCKWPLWIVAKVLLKNYKE